jgi:ATP adenylyltransferase
MDHLWAPWRMAYVTAPKPAGGESCFLCAALAANDDRTHRIVWRGQHGFVVLNRYPYNNGHLLIAPLNHKAGLNDLGTEEFAGIMEMVRRCVHVLGTLMHPDGFNVGLNLGRAAGAGLPGHLHWHIVPRWQGDINFMPVVAETNVLVQSLDALQDLFVGKFEP